ncbi:aromatic compound dioxygenase [Dacryopinax primogenitus]|uniref:Aromatic compound dioxygenase n=1 Tax=Dacryopinax primogenitus (strain DJM 731) TaxID=1858805 RepID=M5FQT2_DACPD|nr:aromatic compound dioxygenase [Dacryopinax primogenitus]EJT99320.1 aromatic compound dioxygenase [Dacryopinax primogenitus]
MKATFIVLSLLALAHAHGALYGRELEAHYKRQAAVGQCSSSLRTRQALRMDRIDSRRSTILGSGNYQRGDSSVGTISSFADVPSGSLPQSLSASGTVLSNGPGAGSAMPSAIGGNMTAGGGAGGMGGSAETTYSPTGTVYSTFNSTLTLPFASAIATAAPASATTQASDGAYALSPIQEEGPYYIPGELIRSDVVENQTGVPFYIEFSVIDINTCEPLVGAAVDIWSCNATGDYSGFSESAATSTGPVGNNSSASTDTSNEPFSGELLHVGDQNDAGSTILDSETFLRGMQITDGDGNAYFTTIVPGWYSGRAPHIHMRVHVGGNLTTNGTYVGGNLTHTGQTFFGEDLYAQIQNLYPYTEDHAVRTTNDEDRPWTQQNGTYAAWNLFYVVDGDVKSGLIGVLNLAVDSTATDQEGVVVSGGNM